MKAPARKSALSQSKPDLLFDDLREVGPPSWIFKSVAHRRGREEAAHFPQKILAQLRLLFHGRRPALQQGGELALFAPMVPDFYGYKLRRQRNALLN